MTLAPAFLDELRARVAVSTVVGRRVKLARAGREMKGCCPFHNEKSPSFFVNDDKGFYHCFGCGVHGDVISFVVEQEGLGFIDAVKSLALEAGLELPQETPEARERAVAVAGLHDVTGAAAEHFAAQLAGGAGAAARAYLDRRGIGAAAIADFGLGFAPDSRSFLRGVLGSVGDAKLVEAGLLIAPEPGDAGASALPYDRFRGRLMFPIRDPRGRVIGFGGRILGDGQPKYLNSPDTPLFDKGRTLYNLDRAGPVARKSGRLIVVEGYMDVIGLAQGGITDVVAPLGTALTEAQLALLWRLVPEPILCFDGDAAGQRAGLRAALRALPLLEPGKSLRFATLPAGQDPDDLMRSGGAAAVEAVLAAARPLHDVVWDAHTAGGDEATPEQKAGIKVALRDLARLIANADVRTQYDQMFRDRFWRRFGRVVDGRPPVLNLIAKGAAELRNLKLLDTEMVAVLVGLLNYPAVAGEVFESLVRIPYSTAKMKNLSQRIIEALTWAPDLDQRALALWLQNEGFGPTAQAIRAMSRLPFAFTRSTRRSHNAPEDLRQVIAAIVDFYAVQDELEQVSVRARASHREGSSAMVMAELELSKQALQQRLATQYARLYDYVQNRPPDIVDAGEDDWHLAAAGDDDPAETGSDELRAAASS